MNFNATIGHKPLRWYRSLANTQGRSDAGAFLVEGERAIRQVMHNNPEEIVELLCTPETADFFPGYQKRIVPRAKFNSICSAKTPQGTAAVITMPANTCSSTLPIQTGDRILLLEDVQDPGNVGTLIRTAAAFNFTGIIMSQQCADPFSPKCVQASAGTMLTLWIRRTANYLKLAGELKVSGFVLAAADLSGTGDYTFLKNSEKLVLALGNEGNGLSPAAMQISTNSVKIHIAENKVQSLNVAVSGAILMHLCCTTDKTQ